MALPTRVAYAASQGAVEGITRLLARDLHKRDITVNAIVAGHAAVPAEVADVVAFLVSQEGHGVNAQVIPANGGLS